MFRLVVCLFLAMAVMGTMVSGAPPKTLECCSLPVKGPKTKPVMNVLWAGVVIIHLSCFCFGCFVFLSSCWIWHLCCSDRSGAGVTHVNLCVKWSGPKNLFNLFQDVRIDSVTILNLLSVWNKVLLKGLFSCLIWFGHMMSAVWAAGAFWQQFHLTEEGYIVQNGGTLRWMKKDGLNLFKFVFHNQKITVISGL